jgi:hypothetical protein
MPDTGAPWNIPYVENADLVSDWPAVSEDVANAVAAGLDLIPAGIGSNVVTARTTAVFSSTSATFEDVTGLAVTFTPTSATSKVLIIVNIGATGNSSASHMNYFTVDRDATDLRAGDEGISNIFMNNTTAGYTLSMMLLDSPATTSPIDYQVRMRRNGGTGYVNRIGASADNNAESHIIAIEVAP